MLPQGNTLNFMLLNNLLNKKETSVAYKIDKNLATVDGEIDGREALLQAIDKELRTEKYKYSIYSWNYGLQTQDLIGKDKDYAYLKLQRRIEECLSKYEQVISIKDFKIEDVEFTKDSLHVSFTTNTIYGEYPLEVNSNNVE